MASQTGRTGDAGAPSARRQSCHPAHVTWSDIGGMMTDNDRRLLDDLKRLNQAIGPFADGIFANSLSVAEQLDFGYQLIGLAARIRARVTGESSASDGVDGEAI